MIRWQTSHMVQEVYFFGEIAFLNDTIVHLLSIRVGKYAVSLHVEIAGHENMIDAALRFQVRVERVERAI